MDDYIARQKESEKLRQQLNACINAIIDERPPWEQEVECGDDVNERSRGSTMMPSVTDKSTSSKIKIMIVCVDKSTINKKNKMLIEIQHFTFKNKFVYQLLILFFFFFLKGCVLTIKINLRKTRSIISRLLIFLQKYKYLSKVSLIL